VQAFAAGLIAARCLRDAGGTADHDLLAAAADLDCVTLFGRFALDPATGAQTGHQLITVQWQDGIRRAVWPPAQAQSPIRIPLPRAHTGVQAISPAVAPRRLTYR
jgi:branched-chain amino acid transport system substrate-binding protein